MKLAQRRGAVFVDLSERLLRNGQLVRFRARGDSMAPTIEDGDRLTVGPADPAGIRPGDIILFNQTERPIVHRVVAVLKGGDGGVVVVARGDAKKSDDAPINPRQILGKVVAIEATTVPPRRRSGLVRFLQTLGSRLRR
jgi:signal peptidase I